MTPIVTPAVVVLPSRLWDLRPGQLGARLLVVIALVDVDGHRFPIDQIGEVLLRHLPECLMLLGRVDAGESYALFTVVGGQDREGVAVGDADDAANQLIGPG